ncbi:MAG: YihA family ribosome biogenesis GTP-binding protein [Ruminococcaceae bacterium]|nr:YihA family ribosome biogenesis GTP-binding protein [Oscillospiraceae bacterium]
MNLHQVEFVRSAAQPRDFMTDSLPQIAFAGKSNVGKSSVINRILLRKNFARVGEAPGKTIHVNYFCVDKKAYFVDLPGYGYAKVPQSEKERWARLMESFFDQVPLALGILIVDARHNPTNNDCTMARWFMDSGCPFVVVANKMDKLKKSEIAANLAQIRTDLELPEETVLIPFSAEKGTGRDELLRVILKAAEG